MNILRIFVVFCLLVLVFSVNACSGLTGSDKAALKTWWLEPYTGTTQEKSSASVRLLKISTTVVPGLDTDRILTLSDDAQLNQYAAARWADNLPELVTSLTGRSLESTARFEVASARAGGDSERCNLQLELREFFADLSPGGQTTGVRVAIDGRYQCGSEAPVHIQSNASIAVHDDRMSVIVAAFQKAMDFVMKEMLTQIP